MAPLPPSSLSPLKRPLSGAESDFHPSKKQRQTYRRHHRLQRSPQKIPDGEPVIPQQESLDKLLIDAIKVICEEQAVSRGIKDPVIESLALEAFRNAVEEFIIKVCATIRRSMISGRRTVPIPPDFESAITTLDLPWPHDQLKPYSTAHVINPPLLPTPPPEDAFSNSLKLPTSFLGPGLDGREDRKKDHYVPSNLPPFPSQHTYKDTPVYPGRENDPRRIRELATEEGKLGEEALRRLAGAVKAETTITAEPDTRREDSTMVPGRRRRVAESAENMFEVTMRELLKEAAGSDEGKFELGPIVNCEKRFLMQDTVIARRRPPDMSRAATVTTNSSIATGIGHELSERTRGKSRTSYVDTPEAIEL